MLRNFIATLILSLTTLSAFAAGNGYCDSRTSMAERQRCYANLQDMDADLAKVAVNRMQNNIAAIKKASIPEATRSAFLAEVAADRQAIDNTCRTNKCVLDNVARLNNKMAAWYTKQTGKK